MILSQHLSGKVAVPSLKQLVPVLVAEFEKLGLSFYKEDLKSLYQEWVTQQCAVELSAFSKAETPNGVIYEHRILLMSMGRKKAIGERDYTARNLDLSRFYLEFIIQS